MRHAEIQAEVTRITGQIDRVTRSDVDDEVVLEARERLTQLQEASKLLLSQEEATLSGLVARNVGVWRDFKTKLRQISSFLDSLQ